MGSAADAAGCDSSQINEGLFANVCCKEQPTEVVEDLVKKVAEKLLEKK